MTAYVSPNQLRSDDPDVVASAQVQALADISGQDPGVMVFEDAARQAPNRLFRRPGPTEPGRSVAYLRTFLTDAYGTVLPNEAPGSFIFRVHRHPDGIAESTRSDLGSDATGKVEWAHAIPRDAPAFNRFKAGQVDRPAAAPMMVPAAAIAYAEGAGAVPAYPRHVTVRGNGFSPNKEPLAIVQNAFGVNSEGGAAGTWFGDAAVDDANGVPTAPGCKSKVTFDSPIYWKPWTSEVSATGQIISALRHALSDAAGRAISALADVWYGRYRIFPIGATASMADVGPGDMRLQGARGYPAGFIEIDPPAEPTELELVSAYADTQGQRDAFSVISPRKFSFASDIGNYGAKVARFVWGVIPVTRHLSVGVFGTVEIGEGERYLSVGTTEASVEKPLSVGVAEEV